MHLHLAIPGLTWPNASTAQLSRDLALPALTLLLRHARLHQAPGQSFEDWLADAFGMPQAPNTPPAFAALRRLGEDAAMPAPGEWLCADPVQLHFAREHLLLTDATDFDLQPDEAAAFIDALNVFFADEPGLLGFEACAPTRWYLRVDAPVGAAFTPLGEVVGRPVAPSAPKGDEARRWQRIANDIQVLLHNHPLNAAREARGQPRINSVWLWGQGSLPTATTTAPPAASIFSSNALARGFARAAGGDAAVPPPHLPDALPPGRDTLVVLDTLHRAALHLDADAWRAGLLDLETNWFAPLLAALRNRRIASLHLSAPGDTCTAELHLRGRDLWKFWHRPRALADLTPNRPPSHPAAPLSDDAAS